MRPARRSALALHDGRCTSALRRTRRTLWQVGSARLTGWYALPGAHQSLLTLRAQFLPLALDLAIAALDGAAVRFA